MQSIFKITFCIFKNYFKWTCEMVIASYVAFAYRLAK